MFSNITPDRVSGIGSWSAADLAAYLAQGHALGRGTASGPMREAVELSLSKLTPGDIAAMVTYVRSVPAIRNAKLPEMAGPAPALPSVGRPIDNPMGKRLFEGNCASCHAWNGNGALVQEAQLTGNRAVNDVTAANVAQMILNGAGTSNSARPYMPSFASAYTDREIAAVANYVTARFGSKPSSISPNQVATLRAQN